jgi:hypothetical protein
VSRIALPFLVCLGLIVGLLYLIWPPQPPALALVGAGYESNLKVPHNAQGRRSLNRLAAAARAPYSLTWFTARQPRVAVHEADLKSVGAWDGIVKDLQSFREPTIVVYLALHGGSDKDGGYLLVDSDSDDPKRARLPLAAVIEGFRKLPKEKNKLLILDATQLGEGWRLGMLNNDFASKLQALEKSIADIPNFWVLSASDVNQRSWLSERWHQTAFAHYVEEGLRGAASDQDTRVNLWELYDYVRKNVQDWALLHRDALQTPVLLPRPPGPDGKPESEEQAARRAREDEEQTARRARKVELTLRSARAGADDREATAADATAGGGDFWSNYHAFRGQVPSPASYAPVLWRRYSDLLVRWDQLLRVDDPEAARTVGNSLVELGRQIEQARILRLEASRGNSLVTAAAEGSVIADPEKARDAFDRVWDAPKKAYDKALEELLPGAGAGGRGDREGLRASIYDLLMQKAAEDPARDLDAVYNVAQAIARNEPLARRPTEIHFLIMLKEHLRLDRSSRKSVDLVRLAIEVRRIAERTALAVPDVGGPEVAPYGDEIPPWIRALVESADEQRRRGEDLLFASSDESNRARLLLEQARAKYQDAQRRAEEVRQALTVRDQVLEELPDYSRWAARRSLRIRGPEDRNDDLLRAIEELWDEAHALVQLLEDPAADTIRPQAEGVQEKFRDLKVRFAQRCEAVAAGKASVMIDWAAAGAALDVPALDRSLRARLRALQRKSAENEDQPPPAPSSAPNALREQEFTNRTRVEVYAQAQGRMSLAVLGQRWFDADEAGKLKFDAALGMLKPSAEEKFRWDALRGVGDATGRRWLALPETIDRRCAEAEANPDRAAEALRQAERLARQLDGAAILATRPAEGARRWRVQSLLVWLAQRTWLDHWFGEKDKADDKPYYVTAGGAYLTDARDLVPKGAEILAMQEKLNRPGTLTFTGPPAQALTSEMRQDLEYRLVRSPGADVPPGYVTAWPEPGRSLELVRRDLPPSVTLELGKEPDPEAAFAVASPVLLAAEGNNPPRTPRVEATAFTLRGFYRGQVFAERTPVDLHPLAETVRTQYPPTPRGTLAVRADEEVVHRFGDSDGTIVIVLDCSGSMGPPRNQPFGPRTKFNEATTALREVLGKVSKGARVSVWIFGQAMGPGKIVEEVERTIVQVVRPQDWDPQNPAQLEGVMQKVSHPAIEPWNRTPLVRAMLMAQSDFIGARGFKTLLVLTDGNDDRFAADRVANPNRKDIPTVLKEYFDRQGIQINLVCFKADPLEEVEARKQFGVIETLPVPGKFYTVEQAGDLASTLERALKRRLRYQVERVNRLPVVGDTRKDFVVSRSRGDDDWFRPAQDPGVYNLIIPTNTRTEKHVEVDAGDRLLLKLVALRGGDVDVVRALFSREDYPRKPFQERQGWRLAVLQNQQVAPEGLQMLTTLEAMPQRGESVLQQRKPEETWIEVKPQGDGGAPVAVRWGNREGYPAPAWGFDVPQWPLDPRTSVPVSPAVRLWWNPDQETPTSVRLDKPNDFQDALQVAPRGLGNREVKSVDGETITIESVRIEEHRVETAHARFEKMPCLVVRVRHAPGKPVWVRPLGIGPPGFEDRFYARAGKYTGLFWPVTEDEVKRDLAGLGLYALEAFKRDAKRRDFQIEMENLPPPSSADRPPGVIDLVE